MDKAKKNKIYIGIIVVCVLVTAGILLMGGGGSTPPVATPQPTPGGSSGTAPRPAASGAPNLGQSSYAAPTVFPGDSRFDTSVLSSGDWTRLKDYAPVTVTPEELGKESLF